MVVPDAPQNLIGDNAYDSDRLDKELRLYGIELIAPHRRNRRASTQDRRRLKRYRRRWKIERLFAWLQNFRRVVVRYERHAENFLGMIWFVTIFGDGGQSGIDVGNPNVRMHTFTGASGDINFNGENRSAGTSWQARLTRQHRSTCR